MKIKATVSKYKDMNDKIFRRCIYSYIITWQH